MSAPLKDVCPLFIVLGLEFWPPFPLETYFPPPLFAKFSGRSTDYLYLFGSLLYFCVVFTIKVWVQLASCSRFPSPLPFSRALLPGSGKAKGTSAEKTKDEEEEEEEPAKLAFEGTIDLSDLVYLGTLVGLIYCMLLYICFVVVTFVVRLFVDLGCFFFF